MSARFRSSFGAALFATTLAVSVGSCAAPQVPSVAVETAPIDWLNSNETIVPASGLRDGKYRAQWLDDSRGALVDEWGEPLATADIYLMDPYDNADGLQLINFFGGCNSISSTLSDAGLGDLLQTLIGCPDDVFEPTLLENLNRGDFQVLNDSQFSVGDLAFSFWLAPGEKDPNAVLRDGVYSGGIESRDENCVGDVCAVMFSQIARATVSERGTQFVFDAGCNKLRTSLADGQFTPVASTRMACPEGSHEDVLLAQINSGSFELTSNTGFRVGDAVFSWSASADDGQFPPLIHEEIEVPTINGMPTPNGS